MVFKNIFFEDTVVSSFLLDFLVKCKSHKIILRSFICHLSESVCSKLCLFKEEVKEKFSEIKKASTKLSKPLSLLRRVDYPHFEEPQSLQVRQPSWYIKFVESQLEHFPLA